MSEKIHLDLLRKLNKFQNERLSPLRKGVFLPQSFREAAPPTSEQITRQKC